MKGLLLKDYYTLFKQAKIFILLILVFAVMPGESMTSFAVVYAAMLPITALAYDERAKWDSLAAMMPYSVRNIVSANICSDISALPPPLFWRPPPSL
ncbi:MAG: ABC-2 transporter permease [Clostridiaceae bacterium]|nr:ABC-2 transporter permease [Clostridiaceae bacterium]